MTALAHVQVHGGGEGSPHKDGDEEREDGARMSVVAFRKLTLQALLNVAAHYGLDVDMYNDTTQSELAAAVARRFAECEVDEEAVVSDFCSSLRGGIHGGGRGFGEYEARKRRRRNSSEYTPTAAAAAARADRLAQGLDDPAALPAVGDQIAAKTGGGGGSSSGEGRGGADGDDDADDYASSGSGSSGSGGSGGAAGNGGTSAGGDAAWILARVVRRAADGGSVEVYDEDDPTRNFMLDVSRVVRLVNHATDISKGDKVLAVFPDTTSFYRATVHQVPKVPSDVEVHVMVKFEGDEEPATGKVPLRIVPARHVLSLRDDGHNPKQRRPLRQISAAPTASSLAPAGGGCRRANSLTNGALNGGGTRAANGGGGGRRPPQAAQKTYGEMISHALEKMPDQRGCFKDICTIIEADFASTLNWKLESDVRKTPVWKSSVRKILFSNSRFVQADPEDKQVFTFAR